MRKKSIHVYLTEEEYAFLKKSAEYYNKSLAATLLQLADFHNRMMEVTKEERHATPDGAPIETDAFSKYEF